MRTLLKSLKDRFHRTRSASSKSVHRQKPSRHRGLRLEPLEERQLLSVTPTIYLPLDSTNQDGDVEDVTGNGHDGELLEYAYVNGTDDAVDLNFSDTDSDYDDGVVVRNVDFLDSLTIAMSVQADDLSETTYLAAQYDGDECQFALSSYDGQLFFTTFNGDDASSNTGVLSTSSDFTDVVVTHNGATGETRFYIDGVDETADSSCAVITDASTTDLFIGARGVDEQSGDEDLCDGWQGQIADFRLFDRVVTPSEMADIHITLDASSETTDLSGNQNDGELLGATITSGVLDLDGDTEGLVIRDVDFLDSLTIAMSVKAESLPGTRYLAAQRDGTKRQFALYWSNNQLVFTAFNGDDAKSEAVISSTGTWYDIVVTHDGTTGETRFYIDGENQTADGSCSTITDSASTDLFLGACGASFVPGDETLAYGWNGQISDFRMYSIVVPPTTLSEIHLSFDNSDGEITLASFGDGYDGELIANASISSEGVLNLEDSDVEGESDDGVIVRNVDFLGSLTIAMSVKAVDLTGARYLASQRDGSENQFVLYAYNGYLYFTTMNGDSASSNAGVLSASSSDFTSIIVTHNGTTGETRFYVDGVDETADSTCSTITDATMNELYIGAGGYSSTSGNDRLTYGWHGQIADFRIFNSVLSPMEIADVHLDFETSSDSDTSDVSGFGHSATLMGVASISNGVLELNGDGNGGDYDDAALIPDVELLGSLTIAMRVRADELSGSRYLAAQRDGDEKEFYLCWYNDRLMFGTSNGNDARSETGIIATDTWYDIVVTHNETTGETRFYVDGEDCTDDASCAAITNANPGGLYVGGCGHSEATGNDYVNYGWDGQIADFRVYERALTATEIAASNGQVIEISLASADPEAVRLEGEGEYVELIDEDDAVIGWWQARGVDTFTITDTDGCDEYVVADLGDFTGDIIITADLTDDTETTYDTISITGTAGADTFTAEPGSAVFEASSGYTVTVSGVRSIVVDGGNNEGDTAIVSGSADNDTATLYPPDATTNSSITGPIDRYDYLISYTGFKDVAVNGNGQAQVRNTSGAITACDTVALYGSTGSETFTLYTTSGTVEGSDYSIAYLNVPWATATGEGGDDEAMLYGSSLDDRFVSKPATGDDFVTLNPLGGSKDYFLMLDGLGSFAGVTADLGAGDDEAELHEVEANLVFEAWTGGASQTLYDGSSSSVLGNATYEVAVTDAEYILGRGHTNATYENSAVIHGVADDDLFVGTALFYNDASKLRGLLYAETDAVDGDRTLSVNAYRFADVDLEVDAADSSRLWALIDSNYSTEYASLPISASNQVTSSGFWDASGNALFTADSFTDTDTYSNTTATAPDPETVSSPTTLALDDSESPTATLNAGETDYFSFTPTTAGHYTFELSGMDADADLKLLDSSGYVLASSLNTGTAADTIYRTLAASTTYYVSVTAYDTAVTDYDLIATASATADQDLETIALVSNGDRLAEIVLPADADAELLAAAEDLRYYGQKLSGRFLEIVEAVSDSTLRGVYLGGTAGASDNTDSYCVTVDTNGNLSLTNAYGYTRPVAYAVSELLEDLGVNWLAPTAAWDHVSGGKAGELSVTVTTGSHEPDTSPRRWSEVGWEESQAWRRRLRANQTASNDIELTDYRSLGNGVQTVFRAIDGYDATGVLDICYPTGTVLSENEWYPVTHILDGSSVEINDMAVDAIVAYLVGDDFMDSYSGDSPYDGAGDLKEIFEDYYDDGNEPYFEQDDVEPNTTFTLGVDDVDNLDEYIWAETAGDTILTNRYYAFVNAVAAGVGTVNGVATDYKIGALAYANAIEPPTTVVFEENVYVYLTQNTAAWWDEATKEADQDRTDAWADEDLWEGSVNLLRYDYFTLGATTPYFYPSLMAESLQYDADNEFLGVNYEATSYYPFQAPMEWVMTQLEWDGVDEGETYEQAMSDLFDDYFEMAYGEDVAELMGGDVMDDVDGSESFFGILEDAWLYQDTDWLDGDYEGSDSVHNNSIAQAESMTLDEANAALAVLDEATLSELASSSPDPLVLERISGLRAAMEYSKYLIEEYELVKELREMEISSASTGEELEAALEKIEELGRVAARRQDAWPAAEGRDDLLGQALSYYEEKRFLINEETGAWEGEGFLKALDILEQYGEGTSDYSDALERLQDASLGPIGSMITGWFEYREYLESEEGSNPDLLSDENGDFESSAANWTLYVDDETGSFSPVVDPDDASNHVASITGDDELLWNGVDDTSVEEGKRYLITAEVKTDAGTNGECTGTASISARFKYDICDGEGNHVTYKWIETTITMETLALDSDWQTIAIYVEIPTYVITKQTWIAAGYTAELMDDGLRVQLAASDADEPVYFDDVHVIEID